MFIFGFNGHDFFLNSIDDDGAESEQNPNFVARFRPLPPPPMPCV
jgi:hypothetical protein